MLRLLPLLQKLQSQILKIFTEELLPCQETEKHLFRFFIEGSIRTYFLGTDIEGTSSFPIVHLHFAELSEEAHKVAKTENREKLKSIEEKLGLISAQNWESTNEEIKQSLEELI